MDSLVLNRLSLSDSRLRYGFSGVYSSDKLPKQRKRYRSFIVNTDPAHCKGRHWQAIYFRQDNHCVFSVLMEHDLTLTLQQCLFGDTEERYHQSIDRSGLTPVTPAWTKGTQRIPRTSFSSLRDAAHRKHAGWLSNGVNRTQIKQHNQNTERNIRKGLWSEREKKKKRNGMTGKRVEIREGPLGYPGFVRPVFTKDSKPLEQQKFDLHRRSHSFKAGDLVLYRVQRDQVHDTAEEIYQGYPRTTSSPLF
ncbi:hypothetical protein TNCV_4394571 [Trichonephila clavipes]|uniref:Uncharacterized protein n=1 Tax=Trichonephila clavipes TaxID=2585209 RepID=A0A8X6W4M4_TRICX|nr:hypothetical protein TNCV_4394571 [Trichonephila clavipes]